MSRLTRVAVVCIALFMVSLLGAVSLQARPLAQMPRPPRDDAPVHFQRPVLGSRSPTCATRGPVDHQRLWLMEQDHVPVLS